MKNLLFKYSYKNYILSKITGFLYKNEFVWLHEKHFNELRGK